MRSKRATLRTRAVKEAKVIKERSRLLKATRKRRNLKQLPQLLPDKTSSTCSVTMATLARPQS